MGCSVGLKYAKKCIGGRGSAPDPTGGAHDAPPDPLVGYGEGHPLPIPHALGASILRFDPRAPQWKPGASRCFRAGYGPVPR